MTVRFLQDPFEGNRSIDDKRQINGFRRSAPRTDHRGSPPIALPRRRSPSGCATAKCSKTFDSRLTRTHRRFSAKRAAQNIAVLGFYRSSVLCRPPVQALHKILFDVADSQ